jgi:hypothetical protein
MHCLTQLRSNDGFPVPDAPDDDRLFALLSHQPILKRGPIVEFAKELVGDQRRHVLDLLTDLLRLARSHARPRKFERYEPTPYDAINRLAAYTANLATLRILLADDEVSPKTLAPEGTDPMLWWRSLVNLWQSGLDTEGWRDILGAFTLTYGQEPVFVPNRGVADAASRARLLYEHEEELGILAGGNLFLWSDIDIQSEAEQGLYLDFVDVNLPEFGTFPLARLLPEAEERFERITDAIDHGMLEGLAGDALWRTLSRAAPRLPFETVDRLVSLLAGRGSKHGKQLRGLGCELAAVVAAHPALLLTNDDVAAVAREPDYIDISDSTLAVVLLWRAEQASSEPELSALRALRLTFDEPIASSSMSASDAWIVPEYLTYLRMNQPAYWNINDAALRSASALTSVLRRTAPQDALYLVMALQGHSKAVVLEFVQKYLTAQGQPIDGLGEDNAVERLAAYAELPWSRP